jgi:two-component sensor histidine kinase
VISSLLDLEAEKFRSREYAEAVEVLNAFRESQDRVMSIALIHEELHKGRGTDTLNFSAYLERLVENLFQTYRVGNVNTNLSIDLEENIFFDMDIAVPLGIITNELVSNSLKYAFLGRDTGKIQIKLQREDSAKHVNKEQGDQKADYNDTIFILTVSDSGIGIPKDFELEDSNSLGLQLVKILVDQLGGEIELKRDSGTKFCIRFTVPVQRNIITGDSP